MNEHFFTCPYCWENISMLVDYSINSQNYIEDCETCCNPIQIILKISENEITYFESKSIEQ